MRVLLIEDDNGIGDALNVGLSIHDFSVDWLKNGKQGYEVLSVGDYDVVVLDLGLPDMDGLAILEKWRKHGNSVPVLILTARESTIDRVKGLDLGADDYLCKPFELAELAARLRALVRRSKGLSENHVHYGRLRLDMNTKTVTLGDEEIALNHREYVLLNLFLLHPSQTFERQQLIEKLYSWEQHIDSNAVDVHIHNIRKKLGKSIIKTRRRLGYQLGEKP